MAEELKGEYKLLKVWECHRCKALIRHGRDISDHKCSVKESEWNKTIENQTKTIDEKNKIIDDQKITIENHIKTIIEKNNIIDSHKMVIDDKNKVIEEHKKIIEERDSIIANKNDIIENQKSLLDDKDRYILNQKNTIEDQNRIVDEQLKVSEEKDRTIENQKRVIESRDKVIGDQNKVISDLKNAIREKEETVVEEKIRDTMDDFRDLISEKENDEHIIGKIPKADKNVDKQYGGEQIYVDIWEPGKSIKDSKNLGYREDIEIEVFEKGKEKKRVIIKSGRVIKKPDDIDIIGKYTPEGFIIKGIQKKI